MKNMSRHKRNICNQEARDRRRGERGSAMIIAILIMGLLSVFVALALSRTTGAAMVMGNDASQARTFYVAQASLETMSRNFNKIFEVKISPSGTDINNVRTTVPQGFPDYQFQQDVQQIGATRVVQLSGGAYDGLSASQDPWQLTTTVTGRDGVQVQLARKFLNNRIPIFQFGVFYNTDMEFYPGGTMQIGGRVHTNGNLFLCGEDLHFNGKVTAAGEVVHDTGSNGSGMFYVDSVFVSKGPGLGEAQVTQGSVNNGPNYPGNPVPLASAGDPTGTNNPNWWNNFQSTFNGNLVAHFNQLKIPLQMNGADPIELIKRARSTDDAVLSASRYFNKTSIRVTLDDSRDRLPGCSSLPVTTPCGRRLDANSDGLGNSDQIATSGRGYQPVTMSDGYQATRMNGNRLFTGASYDGNPRQTWIKVELVTFDPANPNTPITKDVTEDFLSLGLTEEQTANNVGLFNAATSKEDRAIIKLQRYVILGPPIKVNDVNGGDDTPQYTTDGNPTSPKNYYSYNWSRGGYSYVTTTNVNFAVPVSEATTHGRTAPGAGGATVVPFPIEMFDVREGLYSDSITNAQWNALYQNGGNSQLPWRGVMSLVDIDVSNLRRLMSGSFDGKMPATTAFPSGLTKANIPLDDRGLILYVSDRRGDADNDGIYDMENIYVTNASDTTGLQTGEDLIGAHATGVVNLIPDGLLQADYNWESCTYDTAIQTDVAAVTEMSPYGNHRFFRRAVRLVNGSQLPSMTLPDGTTGGFTLATENGAYILGNYNANGTATAPSGGNPTPPGGYPAGSVAASVVADAITILSKAWNDGKSFRNAFEYNNGNSSGRVVPSSSETTVRTALLMGISKPSLVSNPNQGGITGPNGGSTQNMNGGVHNFPRFLEYWTPTRLNYCGSMVSLFYARVSNGSFKFGNGHTYSAPNRNWTFDTNFLVPTQVPPGTPFIQTVQLTGFRQTNS